MYIRRRLYRGKEMINIEVRDKHIYDFNNPLFAKANRVEYRNRNATCDGFNNSYMKKFKDSTINMFSNKVTRIAKENDFKRAILHTMQDVIMDTLIKDDDIVDLLRGEYLIYIGKKEKDKYQYLTQALYYQQEVFPLIEIAKDDSRFNVFFKIILRGEYLKMIKKYKNLRTYARKHFVH